MLAISTQQLSRRFAGGHGVHQLDLQVPAASIYGFLGPNGAGKTTTIRLLLGLIRPDHGHIEICGRQLSAGRHTLGLIGALVEAPSLYAHLSGVENLEVTRRLLDAPRQRILEVLERVGLSADGHRRVRDYSLGMRQRLGIALALLGQPRLLILDEPGNGLDPAGIVDLRRLLRQLVDDGLTVFLSSHLLSEIEQIATHVGVLHAGRLQFQGTLQALRERAPSVLEIHCGTPDDALKLLQHAGVSARMTASGRLETTVDALSPAAINRLLVGAGIEVDHLAVREVTLESLFFDLTEERST